jgi:hypothetical protein
MSLTETDTKAREKLLNDGFGMVTELDTEGLRKDKPDMRPRM